MDLFDRDTLRLTLVNIGLGAACAVFMVIVARAIIRDLAERSADVTRIAAPRHEVGVTMADGGESRPPEQATGPEPPRPGAGREPQRFDASHLKRTIF